MHANDEFGVSVGISGNIAIAGDRFGATGASAPGAVYVFVRNGTAWSPEAYLKASNTGPSDLFGVSVGLSGDTAVVKA